ncbi:MAG: PEP-CTERM sorting domain-containing protein [Gammaproteobacteria bacterium]|nr:PEP-CTERM sorting domain-containing protein [Gammaproteobacteria bacterium]
MTVGATVIDVNLTSTSNLNFVQTGSGTNYWSPDVYTLGTADNAPTASEMVSLNAGGTVTLTFSQAIENVYVGLVSWNNNTVDFGTSMVVDSYGYGYWGNGTPQVNGTGTGFYGAGEVHGVVVLPGSFNSISFTHTSEGWHGFTIGVAGVASAVPEPGALSLLALGMTGFAARRRRRA